MFPAFASSRVSWNHRCAQSDTTAESGTLRRLLPLVVAVAAAEESLSGVDMLEDMGRIGFDDFVNLDAAADAPLRTVEIGIGLTIYI